MKKSLIITAIICLILSITAIGQGVKDKMLVSGYAGFTKGYGDAFPSDPKHYNETTLDFSFTPGFNIGGTFHYGVTDKFMVGGELGFQQYKSEIYFGTLSESETHNEHNILFNGLYSLSYEENTSSMFLTFGGGFYGFGDDEFGIFTGIVYQKILTPSMGIFIMPRFHYVLADVVNPTMITFSLGLSIPVGEK